MSPPASILFPTRRRREYLAVALASVASQASASGAEIIVVEDDPADPATERLAAAHGARYLAHGEMRGLNAARNTAIDAAASELLCFLDDDIEAWPDWLEAMLAAAAAFPQHEVFGGPIRARLEGSDLHACGREPPPITTLDLGPHDRDADFVWGANLTLRRGALERVGRFDSALDLYGDEEEWERRLQAAGGRIRYVARAGVDHRRTGGDARLKGLSRAAWSRGRSSRRFDVRKGTAGPIAGEVRTLAGCVWHTGRRRCGVGIVLTVLTAGRLREALAPVPTGPGSRDPDYLSGESGTLSRRGVAVGAGRDLVAGMRALPARLRMAVAAQRAARRRVLVLGVARAPQAGIAARAARELERSRHAVDVRFVAPAPGAGKWANLNAALREYPAAGYDWLLLVDDDVVLPRGFLDRFLALAERHGLVLVQPAHAFRSHAAWRVTRRRPGALARRTRFVEIGPVTAIRTEAFGALLPFPDLQMGWGLDVWWASVAEEQGWPVGVIDATPIRHLRPVAEDYPREAAIAEAAEFLRDRPYVERVRANETLATWR